MHHIEGRVEISNGYFFFFQRSFHISMLPKFWNPIMRKISLSWWYMIDRPPSHKILCFIQCRLKIVRSGIQKLEIKKNKKKEIMSRTKHLLRNLRIIFGSSHRNLIYKKQTETKMRFVWFSCWLLKENAQPKDLLHNFFIRENLVQQRKFISRYDYFTKLWRLQSKKLKSFYLVA